MTATLLDNIVDGSRARESREGWQEVERIAHVVGLSESGQAKFEEALSVTGMPACGDRHPTIADLLVDERSVTMTGPSTAEVRLTYRAVLDTDMSTEDGTLSLSAPQITVGTTVRQVETNHGVNEIPLDVGYANYKLFGDTQENQTATASVYLPVPTLTVTRRESGCPAWKSRIYSGTVNSGAWSLDPEAEARQWLCLSITGTSNGDGTYEVTYQFEYAGAGTTTGNWDTEVRWRGSNGKIPTDLVDGTGIITFVMYTEKDFNALNL